VKGSEAPKGGREAEAKSDCDTQVGRISAENEAQTDNGLKTGSEQGGGGMVETCLLFILIRGKSHRL